MNVVQISRRPPVWVAVAPLGGPPSCPTERYAADVVCAPEAPAWRRTEFLGGRALLRNLLQQVAVRDAERRIVTAPNGQPRLDGASDISVSISHDGEFVAASVALCDAVGVDIQRPPTDLSESLIQRCVRSPLPMEPAERSREFTWIWTVQEACVKASGAGLAGAPWRIDIRPGTRHGRWGSYRWQMLRDISDTPLSCAYQAPGGTLRTPLRQPNFGQRR